MSDAAVVQSDGSTLPVPMREVERTSRYERTPVAANDEDDFSDDPYGHLLPQRRTFVDGYLVDFNARQAAVDAGCSPISAAVTASNWMNRVDIARAIQQKMKERSERTHVTQDMVLRELSFLGLSNIINYAIDAEGYVSLAEGAPLEAMRAVKSIKRRVRYAEDGSRTIETEIQLWDKTAALKLFMDHLGMRIERQQIDVNGNITHTQRWEIGGREIVF